MDPTTENNPAESTTASADKRDDVVPLPYRSALDEPRGPDAGDVLAGLALAVLGIPVLMFGLFLLMVCAQPRVMVYATDRLFPAAARCLRGRKAP